MIRRFLVLLAVSGAACDVGPVGVETSTFACTSDVTCGAGFRCVAQRCRRSDTCVAKEKCGNGEDDDCNGAADCADDACTCSDGGGTDAGSIDAGGAADAGAVDAGAADAGELDAGLVDAGEVDAGSRDAGAVDAGPADAGQGDAGQNDAGSIDAGAMDAGAVDAGPTIDAGTDGGAPSESCRTAGAPITATRRFSAQSLAGFGPNHAGPIGCASTAGGADRVYAVDLPVRWRLNVTVTPSGGMTPVLDLVDDATAACGALASCLDSATAGLGVTVTATHINLGTTAKRVFIIVADRGVSMSSEAYTLDVKLTPTGDRCDIASTLPSTVQSFVGAAADLTVSGPNCANVSGAADLVYEVALPANLFTNISLTTVSGSDVVLNVLQPSGGTCSLSSCAASADRSLVGGDESVSLWGDGGTAFVAVSSRGAATSSGTFNLAVTSGPPSTDSCATTPTVIASDLTITETLPGSSADVPFAWGGGCVDSLGPDRMYLVDVPPRTTLDLKVASNNDTAINVVDEAVSCVASAPACVASADVSQWSSPPERLRVENAANTVRRVRVFIATYRPSAGIGPYTATFAFVPFIDGDVCAAPIMLDPLAAPLPQTMVGARADYPLTVASNCVDADGGADRIYGVEVPAGEFTEFQVRNTSGFDAIANAFAEPCRGPQACASSSNNPPGTDEYVYLENYTTRPITLYGMVSAKSAPTSTGTFTVAAMYRGDTCDDGAGVFTIREGTSFPAESLRGFRPNHPQTGSGCTPSDGGVDRAYSLNFGAGAQFVAELRAPFDATMNLLPSPASGCSTAACFATAGPNPDGGSSRVLRFVNDATPRRAHLVVSARNQPTTDAGYQLDLFFPTSAPQGDVCGTATLLVSGVTLSNQSTTGLARNYASTHSNCVQNVGPERVYAIDVPSLKSVDLTLTPSSGVATLNGSVGAPWNCGDWCVFGLTQTGGSITGTWPNSVAYTRRVYFMVGGANGTTLSNFSITATVR